MDSSNLESCSGSNNTSLSKSQSADNVVKDDKGKSRKANKPLMEKRRRERINNCLEQLKTFLMDATKKESSYYSKLEKADILELTVKYLKNLKRHQMTVPTAPNTDVMDKYIAGFNECTYEVNKYLNSINGIPDDVRGRLIGHLADSLHKSNSLHKPNILTPSSCSSTLISPNTTQTVQVQGPIIAGTATTTTTKGVCLQTVQSPQVQIVPAKLNSGETIYVLVNAQNIPILGNPVFQSSPVPIVQGMISQPSVQIGDTLNNNTNHTPVTGIRSLSSTVSSSNANTIFKSISPQVQNQSIIPHLTLATESSGISSSDNNFNSSTLPLSRQFFPEMRISPISNQNESFALPDQQRKDHTIEITPEKDNSSFSEQNTSASSSENSSLFETASTSFDGGTRNSAVPSSPPQEYRNPAWDIPGPSNAVMPSYMDPMWRPW